MINLIVAADINWGIGYNNELLEKIPEDLKRFKELTSGSSKAVVMGRKTWDSLPIKPLPNRVNIILSRDYTNIIAGQAILSSMENIQHLFKTANDIDYYIIGGGQIYKELLPYCDKVYLTRIFKQHDNIDTYFPNIDKQFTSWKIIDRSEIKGDLIPYQFITYEHI